MEKELIFTVDSALLQELGEKLVETVHVALVELVKNSYDADATQVEIEFSDGPDGKPEIRITDNGKGMNFDSVQRYWMRIATSNKATANRSEIYGRPLTGAKGIGRFSCRRLGSKLRLETCGTVNGNLVGKQKHIVKTIASFYWKDFKPGTDVTDIKCIGQVTDEENTSTGTTLIIGDISDEWGLKGWNWLKRQLAVMAANAGANRDGYEVDPGFNVTILAPDFDGNIRDIREDYINSGWGTLTAYIDSDYKAVCELNALDIEKKTIKSSMTFPNLKDISLKIGIMVGDRQQLRDKSLASLTNIQAILPEWGGIQVKFNNFRVFPYGDDDWLDIDKDRGLRRAQTKISELSEFASTLKDVEPNRALLNLLSMRSYMGSVSIGAKSNGFEMKLNREGFVHSPAVDELKLFVRYAIDWSTIWRDYSIRRTTNIKVKEAIVEFEELLSRKLEPSNYVDAAVDYIESEVTSIVKILPREERKGVSSSLFKATNVIRTNIESNRAELLHLRLIASTSTLLLIFSHEVKSLLGLLEDSKNAIKIISKKIDLPVRTELEEIAYDFEMIKLRMTELLELTSLVGVSNKKLKTGRISLKPRLQKITKVFSLIINKYEINVDISAVPNGIIFTSILEAEVLSVFLNVISNAIKSVIAGGLTRRIQILAEHSNGFNFVKVRDSGLGIDETRFEEAFVPFVSDPEDVLYRRLEDNLNAEDSVIVGTGSGLGLSIAKEIVTARGGTIGFFVPQDGWKAELIVKLP